MIVLGIDPGLANLGLGVVKGDVRRAQHLHHQVVLSHAKQPMPERLLALHSAVSQVLATYRPAAVAAEQQYLKAQADTVYKVGQAYGVVALACAQAGVPLHTYGPMQVKQALVGTGRADKAQVIYMVRAQLGLAKLENNHAADALALALTHLAHVPLSQAASSARRPPARPQALRRR